MGVVGRRLQEWLAYGAICVVWGSTYLAIKVGLESFEPLPFAALRYWLALPLMAFLARRAGVVFRWSPKEIWPAWGVGVLFIGLCNGMVFWAETRLDSAYTALLITASPLWTAVLSALLRRWLPREGSLGVRGWTGVALGVVGSAVLLHPARAKPDDLVAALVVELSVVIWAAGSLWVRHLRQKFHPFEMATWQMAAGAAFLTAVAAAGGMPLIHGPVTWRAGLSLLYLVVFGSVVAFAAYFFLLRVWPATRVATSAYLNPLVAVVLGWVLLGERLTVASLAGAALVLAGVSLVLRASREEGQV